MNYPLKDYLIALLDRLKYGWQGRAKAIRAYLQQQARWKLFLLFTGIPALIGVLFLCIVLLGVHREWYGYLPTVNDLSAIQNDQASSVISADGRVLGKYYIENRIDAELASISPYVTTALVATEDSRFFEHNGVDLRALLRVAWKSVIWRNDRSGGGSTISQQLAKNLYPRRRYRHFAMLKNKLREMVIASRLEQVYGKEKVLQLYLNTVPFGDNAFGIQVASERFFSKSSADLNIEEAAVLVGLLKGNTYYNPRTHPVAALERRNLVLRLIDEQGQLDSLKLDSLQAIPLELKYRPEAHNRGLATYFREHLRREIDDILADNPNPAGEVYDLYRDGLRIYTTIDSRMQAHAEAAVNEQMPKLQSNLARDWQSARNSPWEGQFQEHLVTTASYKKWAQRGLSHEDILTKLREPHEMSIFDWKREGAVDTILSSLDSLRHYYTLLNAGLLAAEPQTGLVRAWVGGFDHRYVQYDHVKSSRQVGSIIKPVVYATALENGMRPCEYTPAERFTYEDFNNYNPGNPSGEYEGVYSMRGGLAKSINTVAVNIAVRTGLPLVAAQAKKMGLTREVKAIPSLALGTVEANLMEMVQVYSVFANRGRRTSTLHYLDRIETANGEVIVEFTRPKQADFPVVLSDSTAALSTFLMAGVVNNGTAARLRSTYGLRGPIAGKTGTTQDQSDGWFLGFTPKLVIGSWVGAEYPAVHFRTLSRGSATATALPVWGSFLRRVVRDEGLKDYRGGSFPSLDEMTVALLQCPDYLEELPIYQEDSLRGDVRLREVDPAEIEAMMLQKPRRRNESAEDYLDRILNRIEREKRREERRQDPKDFWSNIFFKKDEEG